MIKVFFLSQTLNTQLDNCEDQLAEFDEKVFRLESLSHWIQE